MVSVTLKADGVAKNAGTGTIPQIVLGFSVQNMTTLVWYDLPWAKYSGVLAGLTTSYSFTGDYDLPAGTYGAKFAAYSTYAGGTPITGAPGYYGGGTLTGLLKEFDMTNVFTIVEPTVSVEILSSSVTRLS